jgi:1-acyl-sn-glycerol-3-phosphate acyltransferase
MQCTSQSDPIHARNFSVNPAEAVFRPASRTIFNTPLLSPALRAVSRTMFRALGWRLDGLIPSDLRQAVVIGAPHTSNWDLPYALMAAFVLDRKLHWLGKAQIFRFPFAGLMRWMGGIPVDRSRSNNLVDAAVRCFADQRAPLLLLVPPEGTRKEVERWKTGFYFIALGAEVPVVMAYMDHATRTCGVNRLFHPTGNLESDMTDIRAYYAPFKGWARRREGERSPKSQ